MLLTTHTHHALTTYSNGHLSSTLARKLAQPNHCAALQGCQVGVEGTNSQRTLLGLKSGGGMQWHT